MRVVLYNSIYHTLQQAPGDISRLHYGLPTVASILVSPIGNSPPRSTRVRFIVDDVDLRVDYCHHTFSLL